MKVCVRDVRRGLDDGLIDVRSRNLNPGDDFLREAIPINLPSRFLFVVQVLYYLCQLYPIFL